MRFVLALAVAVAAFANMSDGSAEATIFTCRMNGVVTFSDRPCGDSPKIHESVVETNTYEAPAVAKAAPARPASVRRSRKETGEPDLSRRKETCARLGQSLRDIKSKMRSGYSAKEGERLRERQDKAENQRRLHKCR